MHLYFDNDFQNELNKKYNKEVKYISVNTEYFKRETKTLILLKGLYNKQFGFDNIFEIKDNSIELPNLVLEYDVKGYYKPSSYGRFIKLIKTTEITNIEINKKGGN